MNSYISSTHGDLLLASIFLAMNAVFSILLSLRLERQLIVSALRMITQLFLVGLVLKTIFTFSSLWLTLLAAAVMVTFAAGRSGLVRIVVCAAWGGSGSAARPCCSQAPSSRCLR